METVLIPITGEQTGSEGRKPHSDLGPPVVEATHHPNPSGLPSSLHLGLFLAGWPTGSTCGCRYGARSFCSGHRYTNSTPPPGWDWAYQGDAQTWAQWTSRKGQKPKAHLQLKRDLPVQDTGKNGVGVRCGWIQALKQRDQVIPPPHFVSVLGSSLLQTGLPLGRRADIYLTAPEWVPLTGWNPSGPVWILVPPRTWPCSDQEGAADRPS